MRLFWSGFEKRELGKGFLLDSEPFLMKDWKKADYGGIFFFIVLLLDSYPKNHSRVRCPPILYGQGIGGQVSNLPFHLPQLIK